jgi:regulator of sigma D
MTDIADPNDNPRPRTKNQIDDLLKQRQRMLVLLWQLAKFDADEIDVAMKDALDDFLEILVDYIASGHFGLYRRIAEGKERRSPVVSTAKEIYPRISQTTDVAMDFSDRYESADDSRLRTNLIEDLSTLGEEVTTRIELEDQLIIAMLGPSYTFPSVTH